MTDELQKTEVEEQTKTNQDTMENLIKELGDNLLPFSEGDTVEATILAVSGNRIWVDVAGQSLGFIPEKEITAKTGLKTGDKIFCTVISMEDDAGNVVLSMKRADREKYWVELEGKFESGDPAVIKITDANKGGLMTDSGGIQGFLPVSQLSPEKYPRVSGGDKDEILTRLRKFIGQEMLVKVINCDREQNKLIFSEKAVKANEVKEKIDRFKVGDRLKGRITGVVDFGLFVNLDHQIEGLVHISEVSWSRVSDLTKIFKVGDEVEVMIISIDDGGRISLSVKRLLPDPWVKAASKYKLEDVVSGEVTKITPFGAFVSLDEEIDGLVHISELSSAHVMDPGQVVELGGTYEFKIISIEPESHRLGLSLITSNDKPVVEEVEDVVKVEDKETEKKKNKKSSTEGADEAQVVGDKAKSKKKSAVKTKVKKLAAKSEK